MSFVTGFANPTLTLLLIRVLVLREYKSLKARGENPAFRK